MATKYRFTLAGLNAAVLFSLMAAAPTWAAQRGAQRAKPKIAVERIEPTSFRVEPQIAFEEAVLRVVGPRGFEFQKRYEAGSPIEVDLLEATSLSTPKAEGEETDVAGVSEGTPLPDGRYRYEVVFYSQGNARNAFSGLFFVEDGFTVSRETKRAQLAGIRKDLAGKRQKRALPEDGATPEGTNTNTFVYIYDNPVLGYTWLTLNSNFPALYQNFSMNNFYGDFELMEWDGFSFTTHFTVLDSGYVGIGTTVPSAPLHVFGSGGNTLRVERNDGTTPNIRFATSGGAATQGWVFQNNSTSGVFAIRDATAGNSPVRIFPGGSESSLVVKNGKVGIGTDSPTGKLDVNGSIFQHGSSLHADYVFEPGYELESIEKHASSMWKNKHLPAMPKAKVDEQGLEIVEIGAHRRGIVEELEKAHIYIEQLDEALKEKEARVAELEEQNMQIEEQNAQFMERLKRVESVLSALAKDPN